MTLHLLVGNGKRETFTYTSIYFSDDVPPVPKSCTPVQDDFGASDILDDDFFEDDVLTFIEEVECKFLSLSLDLEDSQHGRDFLYCEIYFL